MISPHQISGQICEVFIIHLVLLLVLQHRAQETVAALASRQPRPGLLQEPEIEAPLLFAHGLGPRLPGREEIWDVLEKRKGIDRRRRALLEDRRELVLRVVERPDVGMVEAASALAVHRGQDDGGRVAADVVVVALGILGELEHGLRRFGLLEREQPVDHVHVEE